jgi:hypothetical protein
MLNTRYYLIIIVCLFGLDCSNFDTFDCFNDNEGCTPATDPNKMPINGGSASLSGVSAGDMMMSGGMTAGAQLGGMTAGTELGGMTAGAQLGGITAGTELGGMTAGTELGGMTAGTELGGMTAGTELGGITAGTGLAGAMGGEMGGTIPTLCDPDENSPLCTECNDEGELIAISDDDDCPDVDCQDDYILEDNSVCKKYHTELAQTCLPNLPICAEENACMVINRGGHEEYSNTDRNCEHLIGCTGSEEEDFRWGCPTPGEVCNHDDVCTSGVCARLALQSNEHQLKVCTNITIQDQCIFEYEYQRGINYSCTQICDSMNKICVSSLRDSCSGDRNDNGCQGSHHQGACICRD